MVLSLHWQWQCRSSSRVSGYGSVEAVAVSVGMVVSSVAMVVCQWLWQCRVSGMVVSCH